MTIQELKEEFYKYLKDSTDYYDPREPMTERKVLQIYLDAAEPREKKIQSLETELKQLKTQTNKMQCCENCRYKQCGMKEIFKAIKDEDKTKVCEEWKFAE